MFDILITDTETGETRTHVEDGCWEDREFMWTEGNFSCDCNRHIFFERAINNEHGDVACGENRFKINVPSEDYKE